MSIEIPRYIIEIQDTKLGKCASIADDDLMKLIDPKRCVGTRKQKGDTYVARFIKKFKDGIDRIEAATKQ